MKKIIFIFALLFMVISSLSAQNILNGTVVDKDGNPIPGVKVKAVGGREHVISNLDGSFHLESGKPFKRIKLNYIGMKEEKAKVHSNMVVKMKKSNWWNEKPGSRWFLAPVMGHVVGTSTYNPAIGLMAGWGRNVGVYFKCITNYNPFENNYCFDFLPLEGTYDSSEWNRNYMDFTFGMMFRLKSPIYLCVGMGIHEGYDFYTVNEYDFHSPFYDVDSGVYVSGPDMLLDVGFIMTFKKIFINVGVSVTTLYAVGEYIMPRYGIGIIL